MESESEYVVTFTDRSETTVTVHGIRSEWREVNAAMFIAEHASEHFGKHAFAAKPAGCTGFAWNVHFGAENACPVHAVTV